eukprot:Skav211010  [mRNA]  locus=scaffold134:4239:5111:+ [translate_table: standard]
MLLLLVLLLPGAVAWTVPHAIAEGIATNQAAQASKSQGFLAEGAEFADVESSSMPTWARTLLATSAVFLAVLSCPRVASASNVNIYMGQGCFWHVQHEVVKQEAKTLSRLAGEVTGLSGYAGGTEVGGNGEVCYHNRAMAPDYGRMGHTEVVNVSVPEEKVGDFAKAYFDAAAKYPFGRPDPQDFGSEYRSAIGIPGGMDGPLFKAVEASNAGRCELLRGQGNDADTVGTKKVWVYDSNKFPFHQAEIYHQFHDDMLERYSEKYHSLKKLLLSQGTIQKVSCPDEKVSEL